MATRIPHGKKAQIPANLLAEEKRTLREAAFMTEPLLKTGLKYIPSGAANCLRVLKKRILANFLLRMYLVTGLTVTGI